MADRHPPGLVAVPMVDWMYSRAALSLLNLSHALPPQSAFSFFGGRTTIAGKRNEAVRALLGQDRLRWLLFVDSDQVVPPDSVQRLLRHEGADIVTGVVPLKVPDYTVNAGFEAANVDDPDPYRPTDNPAWRVRTLDLKKAADDSVGLVEVDVAGCGLMLIRRRVLEGMEGPWFHQNEDNPKTVGQSEDYNFCLRAKAEGFTVACDTNLHCEHIGHHGITVNKAVGYWQGKVKREREDEKLDRRQRVGVTA